jgi:hypothetical protein
MRGHSLLREGSLTKNGTALTCPVRAIIGCRAPETVHSPKANTNYDV